jgi:predicted translin family RNA/ssDNA-binding protein
MESSMEANVRRAVFEVSTKYQSALDQDREKTQKIQNCLKKLRKYKSEYARLKSRYERVTTAMQHQVEVNLIDSCMALVCFRL